MRCFISLYLRQIQIDIRRKVSLTDAGVSKHENENRFLARLWIFATKKVVIHQDSRKECCDQKARPAKRT